MGSYGCGLWKAIFKGIDSFANFISFKANNGERVRFWKDWWCSIEPLYRIYSNLFSLARNKYGMVKEYMIRTRSFCSCYLHLRIHLNDWEVDEVHHLMFLLGLAALRMWTACVGMEAMMDSLRSSISSFPWVLQDRVHFRSSSFETPSFLLSNASFYGWLASVESRQWTFLFLVG